MLTGQQLKKRPQWWLRQHPRVSSCKDVSISAATPVMAVANFLPISANSYEGLGSCTERVVSCSQ